MVGDVDQTRQYFADKSHGLEKADTADESDNMHCTEYKLYNLTDVTFATVRVHAHFMGKEFHGEISLTREQINDIKVTHPDMVNDDMLSRGLFRTQLSYTSPKAAARAVESWLKSVGLMPQSEFKDSVDLSDNVVSSDENEQDENNLCLAKKPRVKAPKEDGVELENLQRQRQQMQLQVFQTTGQLLHP